MIAPSRSLNLAFGALLVLATLVSSVAHAGVRKVEPGDSIELDSDEGLLVVAVDTSEPLSRVRVKRDGDWFDGGTLNRLEKGQTIRLYVVPQGTYRFTDVSDEWVRFRMSDDNEYAFVVKPGVVNYPGHLVFRPTGMLQAMLHMTNRSLLAMDWLAREHPKLPAGLALEYTGQYPDPFPSLYRSAIADKGKVKDRTKAPPKPHAKHISIEELWRPSRIILADLNDSGDLLALATTEKRKDEQFWQVLMIDLSNNTVQRVIEAPKGIRTLDWADNRTLVLSVDASVFNDAVFVVKVSDGKEGKLKQYERYVIPRAGLLVDVLRNDPGHILFSSVLDSGRSQSRMLHRVDVRSSEHVEDFKFKLRTSLNGGLEDAIGWYADARGRVRAGVATRDEEPVLLYGADGEFKPVLSLSESDHFSPIALSSDGTRFYGWSEKDRAQRELVEFDPSTGKIGRTLFSRPGADVQGALFDQERSLIGATVFEEGQLVSHYFDKGSEQLYARLQRAFPGQTVSILDRDAQAKTFVLLVRGSDVPPRIYHLDSKTNTAALLDETRPWLSKHRFAAAHVVKAASKDGLAVEAYLTLPTIKTGEKLPLVVFPHGGPIGIRDSLLFDPEVQFLASLGYAVLQVNFRGSEGYGRTFREAGRKNYGTLIEDDIDAALRAAIAAHPIDESRMCMLGASYGGYSALVSAIRWPGRFRCAISMSGISDQALFFTASDSGRSKEGRAALEQAIGDPRESLEEMKANSPLYRVDALKIPIMLVHGGEDYRVDAEHSRRLIRMLGLAGRTPTVLMLDDAGHGLATQEQLEKVWEGVAGFLEDHL